MSQALNNQPVFQGLCLELMHRDVIPQDESVQEEKENIQAGYLLIFLIYRIR